MNNVNYFSSIVKILENPRRNLIKNNLLIRELRVEIPHVRKHKIIHLIFHDRLANSVHNYYQVNDYVLIEGHLSIKDKLLNNTLTTRLKKVEVNVLKIYPLSLYSKRGKIKIE